MITIVTRHNDNSQDDWRKGFEAGVESALAAVRRLKQPRPATGCAGCVRDGWDDDVCRYCKRSCMTHDLWSGDAYDEP